MASVILIIIGILLLLASAYRTGWQDARDYSIDCDAFVMSPRGKTAPQMSRYDKISRGTDLIRAMFSRIWGWITGP